MEAPDSPPEMSQPAFEAIQTLSPSFVSQAGSSSQHPGFSGAQQANTAGYRAAGGAGGAGEQKVVSFGAPGSTWQTKRYNEEYERAEQLLVDRAWDCSKFLEVRKGNWWELMVQ